MRTTGPAAVTAALVLVTGLGTVTGTAAAAVGPDANSPGAGSYADRSNQQQASGGDVKAPPLTIVMKNIAFYPRQIVAKPGATWTEDNEDTATHNVATDGKNPEKLKAPDVTAGKKATFQMPTKPGKYHLVCNYHQSMKITLTIK
jgi:plastocyanin